MESTELNTFENARADFEQFIGENRWSDALAVISNLKELGYDTHEFSMAYGRAVLANNLRNTGGGSFRSV